MLLIKFRQIGNEEADELEKKFRQLDKQGTGKVHISALMPEVQERATKMSGDSKKKVRLQEGHCILETVFERGWTSHL